MKSKRFRTLALITALSLLTTTGCTNVPGTGKLHEDVRDYDSSKQTSGAAFDYDGNYKAPELEVDGKADDEQWKQTEVLTRYGKGDGVSVKAYRGNDALFFLFEVQDKILLTEGNSNDDAVTRSDSIEFYLDTLADGGPKPQNDDYQINLGIHGKTRIMQGSGAGWGNWNGLIDYEVSLNGTLNDGVEENDEGYSVEVMVPYSQIGIEKDDTIAISFGQVDKTGPGANVGTDWNWYGWTYDGFLREPQTPENYVLFDKDCNLLSRDKEERPAADMAGYVIDSITKEGVSGATVTTVIGGKSSVKTTDDQGYFVFEKVDSDLSYEISVEKEGFFKNVITVTRDELRAVNGGRVLKTIEIKDENKVPKTIIRGKAKNVLDGYVGDVTVKVEGTVLSTVAGADGSFEISGVPAEKDVTLILSKDGYGESRTYVSKADLIVEGDNTTVLGDVNINKPYANTESFGNKSAKFADTTIMLSRSIDGVEFNLVGQRKLTGHIEIYLDTKDCAATREADTSCWCFNLNDDGTIGGTHYAGGTFTAQGLTYKLFNNDDNGYTARFLVPYDYLGISPIEVFGITLGQWSTSANDWDGWGWSGRFRAPETPKTYIRVSATNQLYAAESNDTNIIVSGNVGMKGVKVQVGGQSALTNDNGDWSMNLPVPGGALEIIYSKQGYVTKKTVLENGYFDTHYNYNETITLEEEKVSVSGTVTSTTGDAISGATVYVKGTDISATTGFDGKYVLENVGTMTGITVRFEAEDYAPAEREIPAATLSAGVENLDVQLTSTATVTNVSYKGKVTNVNGAVAGATVSVEGNSELTATTAADGTFVIENFPAIDGKVIISKAGYENAEVPFKADSVTKGATEFNVGEIDMMLEYKPFDGYFGAKSEKFAKWKGYVTRSAKGFEFRFVSERAFSGRIELFVDTKASAGDNARDTSDYLFNLNDDGTLTIVNWGTGVKNEQKHADMVYTVEAAGSGVVARFTMPYAFFGQRNADEALTPTEVIGISAGQWSTSASDWDGWTNFTALGVNNDAFVKPENPKDYVRISAYNHMYAKEDNQTVFEHSYPVHFGTGNDSGQDKQGAGSRSQASADDFYARVVSRDASGVTFEFITTGDFGTNAATGEKEMVLLYLSKGSCVGGWDNSDGLIKIFSDGTVYAKWGKGSAWWSANDSYKTGETVTITRENGVTKFTYKLQYGALGISENEVFGFAMREASHNAGDHMLYDPWFDCYFGNGNGIDAANTTQYIRVAADGTLYVSDKNQ